MLSPSSDSRSQDNCPRQTSSSGPLGPSPPPAYSSSSSSSASSSSSSSSSSSPAPNHRTTTQIGTGPPMSDSSSPTPNQLLSSAIAAVTLKPTNLSQSPSMPTTTNVFCDMQANGAKTNVVAKPQQQLNSPFKTPNFSEEQFTCLQYFETWQPDEQTEFVENLLRRMRHYQHDHVNNFLRPLLQRDFISLLPLRGFLSMAEMILCHLDDKSLCAAELVCSEWSRVISDGQVWKKLIEKKVKSNSMWRSLSEHRGWAKYLYKINLSNFSSVIGYTSHEQHCFYKLLYSSVIRDIKQLSQNWAQGNCVTKKIQCRSENSKGVYCVQYDNQKIVSGLRDNTIKIWNKQGECTQTLIGHEGSVLCLQYDENMIVSGSSDTTIRVWDFRRGQSVNTLQGHREAVLHLRFRNGIMVTCSKDRQIIVWDVYSPTDIQLKRTLVGHRAAVNVVDFDDKYIVSASGDRTIKVWNTPTCEYSHTLTGHKRGIACLQYRGNLVVSGSSDFTIRIWDIETGKCLRVLEGHDELVRCIRFDDNRIVSGAYDGKIKIWDLKAALEQRWSPQSYCLKTLTEHTGRVFRLQFDEFQIVSSSHDDSIIIWDFLHFQPNV